MGDLIPFDEAAQRVRKRRAESTLGPMDWFWMAGIAFWPLGLILFATQAVLDAALPRRPRT